MAQRLEAADRAAELAALGGVAAGVVEHAARRSDGLRGREQRPDRRQPADRCAAQRLREHRSVGRPNPSRALVERIEPRLGFGRPTILCEYPVVEAALARPKPDDPRVAERFELYACGVELANAFGELTDPRSSAGASPPRWTRSSASTASATPLDEDFLAALAALPEASGSRSALTGWSCSRPARAASTSDLDAGRGCRGAPNERDAVELHAAATAR